MRQFHRTCRSWLDERVPALGNKTPRAACRTAAGRRVARKAGDQRWGVRLVMLGWAFLPNLQGGRGVMPTCTSRMRSGFRGVVCLVGLASCAVQERAAEGGPREEEFEGIAGRPTAYTGEDAFAVQRGPRSALGGTGDDVRISNLDRPLMENAIVVHPLDGNILLCANNARGRDVRIDWSLDGGLTR